MLTFDAPGIIECQMQLPNDGDIVLAYRSSDGLGNASDGRRWCVARFVRGMCDAERERLPDGDSRKRLFSMGDEWGNNHRPYCWDELGPAKHYGQNVSHWMRLPEPTEVQDVD